MSKYQGTIFGITTLLISNFAYAETPAKADSQQLIENAAAAEPLTVAIDPDKSYNESSDAKQQDGDNNKKKSSKPSKQSYKKNNKSDAQ
jgi:hypothetical protein